MILNIILSILFFVFGFLLFELKEKRKIDKLKRKLTDYYINNQKLIMKIKKMNEAFGMDESVKKKEVNK